MRGMDTARFARMHGAIRLLLALGLGGFAVPAPAQAQWGDSYEQREGSAPRRRGGDAYYRDDGSAPRSQRRSAGQQEAPRQFYWPWEDRPSQAEPRQAPPTYRQPRPRPIPTYADTPRTPAPRRAARPAPVPEPPKVSVPKAEPTIQIAVFGDSLASHLSRGLGTLFEDNGDIAVVDRSKGDSGLVRRDVLDWPKAAEDYLKSNPKLRYALVMLGANDRQPLREGDQAFDPLSDRWRELYRARVDAMVKVFVTAKVPVIWVGVPPMRSESLTKDLGAINDLVRETVTKAGGVHVDVWQGFVDDRNRFAMTGPDPEGQIAKLRSADGVHFTRAGDRKLAYFADVELKRLMGSAAPAPLDPPAAVAATSGPSLNGPAKFDDVAAIDRQITAMLPSLPEPPGIPSLPVKPVAGPVVPLGRTEISPGGALLSGRPRDADPAGTIDRTLIRGAAPAPQPGRADDFRWPPG